MDFRLGHLGSVKPDVLDKHIEELKGHLTTLNEFADSEVEYIKKAITKFISSSLDEGVHAQKIFDALKEIYHNECFLDNDIYHWSTVEVERENQVRNPEATSPVHNISQQLNEVYFNKEIVQNALVACHLLGRCTHQDVDSVISTPLPYPHSLCKADMSDSIAVSRREKKVNCLDLSLPPSTMVATPNSSSEHLQVRVQPKVTDFTVSHYQEIPVEASHNANDMTDIIDSPLPTHHYLIAKQAQGNNPNQSIYYIAFSSHEDLTQWRDNHASFEEGMYKYLILNHFAQPQQICNRVSQAETALTFPVHSRKTMARKVCGVDRYVLYYMYSS